jgi:hypothetical protein
VNSLAIHRNSPISLLIVVSVTLIPVGFGLLAALSTISFKSALAETARWETRLENRRYSNRSIPRNSDGIPAIRISSLLPDTRAELAGRVPQMLLDQPGEMKGALEPAVVSDFSDGPARLPEHGQTTLQPGSP